mgnify:FL=1
MLIIQIPKGHMIRGRGHVKCNKKYIKGRGFVDMITQASKVISPIASTTNDIVTIGKNTAEIVNKIKNRNNKKSVEERRDLDMLISELKSGRGFQYV